MQALRLGALVEPVDEDITFSGSCRPNTFEIPKGRRGKTCDKAGTSLEHLTREQALDRAAADLATLRLIDEERPEPRFRECGNDKVRMTAQQNVRERATLV
jgi:hypothetical protein